jgi:hypothetical protein
MALARRRAVGRARLREAGLPMVERLVEGRAFRFVTGHGTDYQPCAKRSNDQTLQTPGTSGSQVSDSFGRYFSTKPSGPSTSFNPSA